MDDTTETSALSEITTYRVRQSTTHPERSVRKAWYGRTWQAEWEPCPWCPRAYTKRGVARKARRWQARGLEWHLRHAHRLTTAAGRARRLRQRLQRIVRHPLLGLQHRRQEHQARSSLGERG